MNLLEDKFVSHMMMCVRCVCVCASLIWWTSKSTQHTKFYSLPIRFCLCVASKRKDGKYIFHLILFIFRGYLRQNISRKKSRKKKNTVSVCACVCVNIDKKKLMKIFVSCDYTILYVCMGKIAFNLILTIFNLSQFIRNILGQQDHKGQYFTELHIMQY